MESLFKNCLFINPLRVQTCLTVIYSPITNNKPTSDEEQNQAGLLRFNIPEHTPIIFSLVNFHFSKLILLFSGIFFFLKVKSLVELCIVLKLKSCRKKVNKKLYPM